MLETRFYLVTNIPNATVRNRIRTLHRRLRKNNEISIITNVAGTRHLIKIAGLNHDVSDFPSVLAVLNHEQVLALLQTPAWKHTL